MFKKLIKKGFTIVELVIVIAVIAVLSAVLIPTFSNIIEQANISSCLQEAKNSFTEIYGMDMSDGYLDGKDNGNSINLPSGVTWVVEDDNNFEFSYTDDKGITWSYFCENGSVQWVQGSCAHTSKSQVPGKPATCTEYGLEAGEKCNDCQKTFQTKISPLGHEFGPWESASQGDIEVRTCTRANCGVTEERNAGHEHNYTSVVTNPTCIKGGYTTYTCSCGDSYTGQETAMLGHTPGTSVKENEVAATCGAGGSYDDVVYCTVCTTEISRVSNFTPASGHNYGNWLSDFNKHWKQCSCGDKSNEGEHTLSNGTCSVCGYGCSHSALETLNGKAATCTETGLTEGKKCTLCQTITVVQTTIEIDLSNHTGSSVNGGTAGVHTKYSCCGTTISSTHTYNQDSGVKYSDATCQSKQKNYKSCSCGFNPMDINNVIEVGSLSSESHTGSLEWTITTTQHTQKYNCCDKVFVATTNHTLSNGTCSVCGYGCSHGTLETLSGKAATCTQTGLTEGKKCTLCQTITVAQTTIGINSSNHTGSSVNGGTSSVHTKYSCCNVTISSTHIYDQDSGIKYSDATCKTKQKNYKSCSCGYNPKEANNTIEVGSVDSSKHTGTTIWVTTTTQHTQQYNCCDKVVVASTNHTFTNGTCTVCGYGCLHGTLETISGKAATCTQTGLTEGKKCTLCQTITVAQTTIGINSSNHTGSSVNGGTAGVHTKYSCCGTTISSTHIYNQDSGVKYSEATCLAKQKNYASCACGYNPNSASYTIEVGSKNSSNHTGTTIWVTTTTQHTQQYNCCEKVTISPSNHNIVNGTCSICGYEYLTIPFEDNFNSNTLDNNVWKKENNTPGVNVSCNLPSITNGVVTMVSNTSLLFDWTKLATYDSKSTYIFEFDFKVTNLGNDSMLQNNGNLTRALYVAMGGWYNQMEIGSVDPNGPVRAGGTYRNNVNDYLNRAVHAKVVWKDNTITSYFYDSNGTLIISGYRTSSDYSNGSDIKMQSLVIRCEDGAVEIDNFKFDVEVSQSGGSSGNGSPSGTLTTSSSTLTIASGKAATYSFTYNYQNNNGITVNVNGSEVLSLEGSNISICGSDTNGSYTSGNYTITLVINPTNKILEVEIVLPTGRTIRRGLYSYITSGLTSYTVSIQSYDSSKIIGTEESYENVSKVDYTLTTTEPIHSGFKLKVYNVITSFEDAATTRSFAFTATNSYSSSSTMSLGFRVKGESEWNYVDAVKETELSNTSENYYKVDIANLTPNTEYEYIIGKKNGGASDWSETYSFKTASNNIDEFTFIAVGDTQGITWSGTSESTKGFMFAKAAYEQALKDVSNPAFILHTGDVVENGHDSNQWNLFFKALNDIGTRIPHFATVGNHDYQNNTYASEEFNFTFHFNHPNNGGLSALDSSIVNAMSIKEKAALNGAKESIYSYNYGDAHFVVLASGRYDLSYDQKLLNAQRAWLDADLKANANAKWKIVIVHEPVYHRKGGNEARPWLYDVIESNGVDLVIQGHSHLPTRTYPMKNGSIASITATDSITKGVGTVYTTIGSTAYNHDSLGNPNMEELFSITTTANDLPTYAYITINNNKIMMTIKQIDGYIIDQFEIVNR